MIVGITQMKLAAVSMMYKALNHLLRILSFGVYVLSISIHCRKGQLYMCKPWSVYMQQWTVHRLPVGV